MTPVRPLIPGMEMQEVVFAKDQPEYIPLPTIPVLVDGAIQVITRWRLTDEERAEIAAGADVWLEVMTFGGALQPVRLSTTCPITPIGEPS